MTMSFRCNCCGKVEDIPQHGAQTSADVSNDGSPPKGWRTIYTVIEEHDGDNGIETSAGEILHSCDDCNANMDVSEHLEAEFEARKLKMFHPPEPNPKRVSAGRARAAKLTPERRSEIARNAARARWKKPAARGVCSHNPSLLCDGKSSCCKSARRA